jgi:hypothetical protein
MPSPPKAVSCGRSHVLHVVETAACAVGARAPNLLEMRERVAIGDLELRLDTSPADWLVEGVDASAYDVGALVSWADVAAAHGGVTHPAMQWVSITGSWEYLGPNQPGAWNRQPEPRLTLPPPAGRLLSRRRPVDIAVALFRCVVVTESLKSSRPSCRSRTF